MHSRRLPPTLLILAAVLIVGVSIAADTGSPLSSPGLPDFSGPPSPAPLASIEAPAAVLPGPALTPAPEVFEDYSVDTVGLEPGEAGYGPDPGLDALSSLPLGPASVSRSPRRYFPALYNPGLEAEARQPSYSLAQPLPLPAVSDAEAPELPLLANNQVLAFYGNPLSRRMGILGEYSKEDLCRLVKGYAKLYDQVNGGDGVVPAYYLIYGTCWPGGEIGYLKESLVRDYVNYAAREGLIVFVDHQIGRFSVEEAMKCLLPWLKYPNVHLALDPEWRTTAPMQEIGSISAEEVNLAQKMMSDYMNAEGIPGVRILVVHQFRSSMILGRERVRADNDRVLLVHTADGFGAPALKKNTYALNAMAGNMPLKGFKLFFKTTVPGAGYDEPLLTPPEVLKLNPRPALVIYQ